MGDAPRCWIGVAARAHVLRGVEGGFCQLGHGKQGPVARLRPGDRIVYYSSRETTEDGAPLRRFTAIGEVAPGEPYLVAMSETFSAYRRNVQWWPSEEAAIAPLIEELRFIKDKVRWGFPFRRGAFTVTSDDFARIGRAMSVAPERLAGAE